MKMWVFFLLKILLLATPVPPTVGALGNDLVTLKTHQDFLLNQPIINVALAQQVGGDVMLSAPLEPYTYKILPLSSDKTDNWPRRKSDSEFNLALTAKSVYVMDKESGAPLYEKETEISQSIASLTKLMSAAVFLNQPVDWRQTVTIDESDGLQGRLYVEPGEEIRVKDLFFTSLTGSSNNATVALARSTGLGLARFVEEMNNQAKKWGLKKTIFVEPTGLDPGNQSSAREVAYLLKNALEKEPVREATTAKSYFFRAEKTGWAHEIPATDELLSWGLIGSKVKKINGGKTGYIEEAGFNFAAEFEDSAGHQIIVVVLGADSHWSRFSEAKDLAEWVFSNFVWP